MNKKYNILLIQFPLRKILFNKLTTVYPLGLSYLAAVLDRHSVSLFDPNIHKDHLFKLRALIKERKPDIIGISLRVIVSFLRKDGLFPDVKSYLSYIKSISPRSLIIIGGCGFNLFAKNIMEQIEEIDYGIFLDGDESFPELLDNLENPEYVKGIYFRKNNKVFFSGERKKTDFGNSLLPRRDFDDINAYIKYPFAVGVRTKIGCVFHCSYCHYIFLNGNKIRIRPVKDVVDEVEQLARSGVSSLFFVDNIFNFPQQHAEDICREIIKRNLNVKWKACFHLKYLDKDFLSIAKKAGCAEVAFSPDGFSLKTLKILEKEISINDIIKSYDLCAKLNLKTYISFLIQIPFETAKDLWNLSRLIFRLKKAKIDWGALYLIPNTKLYNMIVGIYGKPIYLKRSLSCNLFSKLLRFILVLRYLVPEAICERLFRLSE